MFLEQSSIIIAEIIGFIGVSIMCIGAIKSLYEFLHSFLHKYDQLTEIRIGLVKHLSLGLEFLVARDIIATIIQPSLQKLGILLAIILLRTLLAYILLWEVREASKEIEEELAFEEALEHFEDVHTAHNLPHKK